MELRPVGSEEGHTLVERQEEVSHRLLRGRSHAIYSPDRGLSDELPVNVVNDRDR
jgi:hypothetical protein